MNLINSLKLGDTKEIIGNIKGNEGLLALALDLMSNKAFLVTQVGGAIRQKDTFLVALNGFGSNA